MDTTAQAVAVAETAAPVTTEGNTPAPVATSAPSIPATMAPQVIPISVRVEQYIKLRDLIKEKDDEHKKAMEKYRDALEQLNGVMLNHLNTIGGDSVKSEAGTVYRTTKRSASLEDADQFMRHVIGGEHWELLERKASLKAVEAYVEENGVLPPGVKWSSTQVVGVRRS